AVAGRGARHERDAAVRIAGDAIAARGERGDVELDVRWHVSDRSSPFPTRKPPRGIRSACYARSMESAPKKRRATYQDILDAPEHLVAEIVAGELHLSPKPAYPHVSAASTLIEVLGPPFRRGRGGPG